MDNWLGEFWDFFALKWFMPSTLMGFTWDKPTYFYALALVPLLFLIRWLVNLRTGQKLPIAVTEKELKWDPVTLLRFLPPILMSLALVLIIAALARPQKTNEKVERWTEGIDIMLVIDISQSMQIEDFKPNRLESAKKVARNFVNGRFQDRIGLVVFSGDAYSLSPLTTDYDLLTTYINDINFDLIETSGTAIGSALAVATNRMRESEVRSKVLILLSDGDNNAGNLIPLQRPGWLTLMELRFIPLELARKAEFHSEKTSLVAPIMWKMSWMKPH